MRFFLIIFFTCVTSVFASNKREKESFDYLKANVGKFTMNQFYSAVELREIMNLENGFFFSPFGCVRNSVKDDFSFDLYSAYSPQIVYYSYKLHGIPNPEDKVTVFYMFKKKDEDDKAPTLLDIFKEEMKLNKKKFNFVNKSLPVYYFSSNPSLEEAKAELIRSFKDMKIDVRLTKDKQNNNNDSSQQVNNINIQENNILDLSFNSFSSIFFLENKNKKIDERDEDDIEKNFDSFMKEINQENNETSDSRALIDLSFNSFSNIFFLENKNEKIDERDEDDIEKNFDSFMKEINQENNEASNSSALIDLMNYYKKNNISFESFSSMYDVDPFPNIVPNDKKRKHEDQNSSKIPDLSNLHKNSTQIVSQTNKK